MTKKQQKQLIPGKSRVVYGGVKYKVNQVRGEMIQIWDEPNHLDWVLRENCFLTKEDEKRNAVR